MRPYSIWYHGKIWSFKNFGSFMFLPRNWQLFFTLSKRTLFTQVGPFRLTWPRKAFKDEVTEHEIRTLRNKAARVVTKAKWDATRNG